MTETPRAKGSRFVALDLLRFLAVVLMVQGHTFYAVLTPVVKSQRWYLYHGYVHGYTAPIFFFSSGLAFGITTLRQWEHHLSFGRAVLKRFERYAILLLLGYGMHSAVFSLRGILALSREELMPILEVDTLQNIAVTLAVVELLAMAMRTPPRFIAAVSAVGLLAVLIAPWAEGADVSGLPVFFAAYVNDSTTSIFPLAPWSGFVCAGVVTAWFLYVPETRSVREKAWKALLLGGLVMIFLANRLSKSGFDPFPEHNFWKTSPYFFLLRVGVIWVVLSVLCIVEERVAAVRTSKVSKLVQELGQETLVVYVAHLFVLYGTPWSPSLHGSFPETMTLGQATFAFLCLFVAMIALGITWHRTKRRHPKPFDRTRWAVTAILLLAFVVLPPLGAPFHGSTPAGGTHQSR